MTNTEPTAPQVWILAGLRGAPGEREVVLKSDYDCLTSAHQVERERADKAEQNYRFMLEKAADKSLDGYRELASKVLANEIRAEKAEAERDKLRAELAALKEALRNPTDDMVSSGLITARETGEITEVFKAMTANLLKD